VWRRPRPGLLHNWGVAVHTADAAAADAALTEADLKLSACIGFSRGDVAPLNALVGEGA
jgi:hypothetical protein